MIIGREDKVNPAKSVPQSAEYSPNRESMPTGIVFFISSVMNISGKKKSFHDEMKLMIITVPNAGLINGIKTLQRILRSLAPSILAASSNSTGIVRKNPVNMRMDNGIPPAVYIKIRDQSEFNKPRSFIKINNGTIPSLMGIIIPIRKKKNKKLFHQNVYLAI